jgi:hypothetical protein
MAGGTRALDEVLGVQQQILATGQARPASAAA